MVCVYVCMCVCVWGGGGVICVSCTWAQNYVTFPNPARAKSATAHPSAVASVWEKNNNNKQNE